MRKLELVIAAALLAGCPQVSFAESEVAFASQASRTRLVVVLKPTKPTKIKSVTIPQYLDTFKHRKTYYSFRWNSKQMKEAQLTTFASDVCNAQKKTLSQPDWNRGGPIRNQKAAFTCN
ncbi:MAG: hypothetical protein ACRBB0_09785 [Pelagimonas sp.]|uniref:hypothetical protein n=1 Tax=Pelagimonas sp. TaxID=2073170 RepID=UPI003D6A7173